jgi:hypothetical protein
MKSKLKKLPTLRTDGEAEEFVATSDLTEYDLSGMRPMRPLVDVDSKSTVDAGSESTVDAGSESTVEHHPARTP